MGWRYVEAKGIFQLGSIQAAGTVMCATWDVTFEILHINSQTNRYPADRYGCNSSECSELRI